MWILVLIAVAGMAAVRAVQAWLAWRNPGGLALPVSRHAGRTVLAQAVILGSAAIVVGVAGIMTGPAAEGQLSGVRVALMAVGVAGVLFGGAGAFLISTIGRPRFLVPPRLRADKPDGQ
jgi:hypothetical protein